MSNAARALAAAATALILTASAAAAQAGTRHEISLEVFGGTAWSFHTPLSVRLPGNALRQTAHYSTRPFADAPYYAYRIGYGTASRGVDAELLHHKLYLENPAPPIEHFEVTHGYNLVTTNARAPVGRWQLRAGVGLVIAHAEGTIAGQPVGRRRTFLGGGYHIVGATTQVSFGRRYP